MQPFFSTSQQRAADAAKPLVDLNGTAHQPKQMQTHFVKKLAHVVITV